MGCNPFSPRHPCRPNPSKRTQLGCLGFNKSRDRISTPQTQNSGKPQNGAAIFDVMKLLSKLQEPQALHVSRQRQLRRRIPVQSTYHHFEHLRCLHFQNVFQWWKVVCSGKGGTWHDISQKGTLNFYNKEANKDDLNEKTFSSCHQYLFNNMLLQDKFCEMF